MGTPKHTPNHTCVIPLLLSEMMVSLWMEKKRNGHDMALMIQRERRATGGIIHKRLAIPHPPVLVVLP